MADLNRDESTPATPLFVLLTIVLIAMLIGGNFTALKFALDHAGPFMIAALRTVIGGTFLVAIAVGRGERFPTDRTLLARIFVVSFSITTVSSALLVFGVNRVPAGFASLISSTMPLFTACLTLVLLHTRISRLGMVGLIVGFVGTAVLASPALDGDAKLIGAVSLLCSAVAWARFPRFITKSRIDGVPMSFPIASIRAWSRRNTVIPVVWAARLGCGGARIGSRKDAKARRKQNH